MTETATMDADEPDYEAFEQVEPPDEPTAEQLADVISEQFYDPTVTAVVALHEDGVVEYDASDIGSIHAVENRVDGFVRNGQPAGTIEELRVRSKPWLTDRMGELMGTEPGESLTLDYLSRFGGDVEKDITVDDVQAEPAQEPYGYPVTVDDDQTVNLDVVAVFGHREGAEYSLMAQSNGGVQMLMNDTRIVEPGTVPAFR